MDSLIIENIVRKYAQEFAANYAVVSPETPIKCMNFNRFSSTVEKLLLDQEVVNSIELIISGAFVKHSATVEGVLLDEIKATLSTGQIQYYDEVENHESPCVESEDEDATNFLNSICSNGCYEVVNGVVKLVSR
jgi:hypothetical protein